MFVNKVKARYLIILFLLRFLNYRPFFFPNGIESIKIILHEVHNKQKNATRFSTESKNGGETYKTKDYNMIF